ncbi:MAG: hypothetical protein ACOZB0_03405 [Pseudomonadota bacterium]
MIAIAAGMRGSSTIFSLNVVREGLDLRGAAASCLLRGPLAEALAELRPEPGHLAVMTHVPDGLANELPVKGAAKCKCTIRKSEDVVASRVDPFCISLTESVDAYRQWLAWHQGAGRRVLNIGSYVADDFKLGEPLSIWWRYCKAAVYWGTMAMDRAGKGVTDVGFSYYDGRTFFHRGHVSSLNARVARDVLSVADIEYVWHELKDYPDA